MITFQEDNRNLSARNRVLIEIQGSVGTVMKVECCEFSGNFLNRSDSNGRRAPFPMLPSPTLVAGVRQEYVMPGS